MTNEILINTDYIIGYFLISFKFNTFSIIISQLKISGINLTNIKTS